MPASGKQKLNADWKQLEARKADFSAQEAEYNEIKAGWDSLNAQLAEKSVIIEKQNSEIQGQIALGKKMKEKNEKQRVRIVELENELARLSNSEPPKPEAKIVEIEKIKECNHEVIIIKLEKENNELNESMRSLEKRHLTDVQAWTKRVDLLDRTLEETSNKLTNASKEIVTLKCETKEQAKKIQEQLKEIADLKAKLKEVFNKEPKIIEPDHSDCMRIIGELQRSLAEERDSTSEEIEKWKKKAAKLNEAEANLLEAKANLKDCRKEAGTMKFRLEEQILEMDKRLKDAMASVSQLKDQRMMRRRMMELNHRMCQLERQIEKKDMQILKLQGALDQSKNRDSRRDRMKENKQNQEFLEEIQMLKMMLEAARKDADQKQQEKVFLKNRLRKLQLQAPGGMTKSSISSKATRR
eukprot:TRINITY_DN778208_c0_g1_i1.p1 TRINITY_DN778208_c0_g1~~TRINITY_DN778208_c0_g1_i1.p1  ORF type:complete len:412 (+),score=120.47 TRINITY_DN778208_c0_g1_i1:228-1463(+)